MKKPKKTTAAKPPTPRNISSQAKGKIAKVEAAEAPEKSGAKKRTKAPEAVAPAESILSAKPESSEETKRSSPIKPKAKRKSAATTRPEKEVKPAVSEPAPVEAKAESAIKPVAKKKRPAVTKTAVETKGEAAPKVEAKPARSKVKATSKIVPLAEVPAKVESKSEVPAEEVKPVEPLKKTTENIPVSGSKPIPMARPAVKLPLAGASETEEGMTEADAPEAKPILPVFSAPVKQAARKAPERIPPILFEGDKPEAKVASGPGQRYALGPTAPAEKFQTEGELPESYGTGELLLTARDPHWLYTHWDLSGDQQRRYNAFSRDGHLVVRVYVGEVRAQPAVQVHVHPESRHWFVHVDKANTRYVAELGYYSAADKWMVVARSASTLTPPDAVSAETMAEFATIPVEVPMQKLLSLVKEAVQEHAPLAQAMQELRKEGYADLPPVRVPASPTKNGHRERGAHGAAGRTEAERSQRTWTPSEWTPAQERALAEVVSMDQVRRVWMGSLEITELIRRQFMHEVAAGGAPELGALAPTSPTGAVTAISSPGAKAAQPAKGFWFNVNAELIVYGATEKDATVTIAGRKIKLRPDGSFSYRFALPDGNYDMPIVAVSADETDGRAADLAFSRSTEYRGDVGTHPQDSALQKMTAESF